MKHLQEINLHLNINKCEFGVDKISFVGNMFTSDCMQVDPEKVNAFREMPTPTTKQEVQWILRVTNYLKKMYRWSQRQDTLCSNTHTPRRTIFGMRITIQSSIISLKASLSTILHSLTTTRKTNNSYVWCIYARPWSSMLTRRSANQSLLRQKCSQQTNRSGRRSKKLLAIVFACTMFHDYINGKEVIIKFDHKPLETIFKTTAGRAPARLKTCFWNCRSKISKSSKKMEKKCT